MAKSKLVKANRKLAKAVVSVYKKIETGAVNGFQKLADGFVAQFLTHDGETVEEARARLKAEEAARHGEK